MNHQLFNQTSHKKDKHNTYAKITAKFISILMQHKERSQFFSSVFIILKMLFFLSLVTQCENSPSETGFFPVFYFALSVLGVNPVMTFFWRMLLVLLILVLTLLTLVFYVFHKDKKKPSRNNQTPQQSIIQKQIKSFLKFFQETYIFWVNIPTNSTAGHIFFKESDIQAVWKFIAILTFLASVFFSNILFFSQNCMSFRVRNPLSFKLNFTLVFLLNLEITFCFVSSGISNKCLILNGFITVFFIILLVHAFSCFPFFSSQSNVVYVSSLIAGIFVSASIFISHAMNFSYYIDLWFFLCVGVPLCVKLGVVLTPKILMRNISSGYVEGDFHSFEIMVRDLCNDYIEMKSNQVAKFKVLGFFHLHLRDCIDLNCLCQKLNLSGVNQSSKEYLRKTLFYIINNLFFNFCSRSRGEAFENTILLHGSFLLTVEGIPNKTLCLLLGQKWKFRSVINRVKLAHMLKQTRKRLQKSISAAGGAVENFSAAIIFEEALIKVETKIIQYFTLLKSLMNLIMQEENYSVVEHFYQSATNLIEQCRMTCDDIINLLDKNPNNHQLIELATVFSRFLFQDESLQNFLKHIVIKQITDQLVKKKDTIIDVYDPEAGVIFISLLEPVGRIEKVTRNVLSIFEYELQEIIHRDIKLLMPGVFAKDHSKYLMDFINSGKSMLLSRSSAILYGVTKRRNLKPLSIMLRIDTHFHENFLIGGFIKPVKSYYTKGIMTDENGKILHFTKDMQEFVDPDNNLSFDKDYMNIFNLVPELLETLTILEISQKEVFDSTLMKEPLKLKSLMLFPTKYNRVSALNTLLTSQRSTQKKTEYSKLKLNTRFNDPIRETLEYFDKINLNNYKLYRISFSIKKESFANKSVNIFSIEISDLFELKRRHQMHYSGRVIEQFRDFFNQINSNNLTRSITSNKKKNIKEKLELANKQLEEFEMEVPDSTRPSHIEHLMMRYQTDVKDKNPSGSVIPLGNSNNNKDNILGLPQISHDYDSRSPTAEMNDNLLMSDYQNDPLPTKNYRDRENSRVSTLSRIEEKANSRFQTLKSQVQEEEQAQTESEKSNDSERILSKLTSSGEIRRKFEKVEGSKASSRASRNDQKTILDFLVKSERGKSRILIFLGVFLFFSFVIQLVFLVIFDNSQINLMSESLDSKELLGMQLEGISQLTKCSEELRLYTVGIFNISDESSKYRRDSLINSIKYNFALLKYAYVNSQSQGHNTNSQKMVFTKTIKSLMVNNELDHSSRSNNSAPLSQILTNFFLGALHYEKFAENSTPELAIEELYIFEDYFRGNIVNFVKTILDLLDSITKETMEYFQILLNVHNIILICFLLFVLLGIIVIIYLTFQIKLRNYKFLTLMFTFNKKLIQERIERIDILLMRMNIRQNKNLKKPNSGRNTYVSQGTKASLMTKNRPEGTNRSKVAINKKHKVVENIENTKYGLSGFVFSVIAFILAFCLIFTAIFLSHFLFSQSKINTTKLDINDKNSIVDSFVLSKIKYCLFQLQINSYFISSQDKAGSLDIYSTTMADIKKRERLIVNPTNFFKNERDSGSDVNLKTKVFFMEDLCSMIVDLNDNNKGGTYLKEVVNKNTDFLAQSGFPCKSIWDGIMLKGAVAFNYKVNSMLDDFKQKIYSVNYTIDDLKTIMKSTDYRQSSDCLFYMDLININIGGQINTIISDSLKYFSDSIIIWMVVAFIVTILFFGIVWSRYTTYVTESIEKTYTVLRIFPMKLIKQNKVLESRIRYLVRSNMMV